MFPSEAQARQTAPKPVTHCFSLVAKADPGIMPRVMALFAKRALVPDYWCSRLTGAEITIDLQVACLDPDTALYLAACFRQMPGMSVVLMSEKHPPAARALGSFA
jgi:hypothetical protein